MRVYIYFGRISHCTSLDCQEAKNSGDIQSVNWSLLGGQGSTERRIVPPGPQNCFSSPFTSVWRVSLAAPLGPSLAIFISCMRFPAHLISPQTSSRQSVLNQPILDGLML